MKISLPKKKSYSLDELPEYLAKTYQLDLSHDDLIVYARENKLKTCIRLEGNAKGLYSVGRIKLDEQNLIPVCYPPTAVFFNSTIKKSFLPHDLHLEDEYACFGARTSLVDAIYKEIQEGNLDYYSATMKAKTNINEFIEQSVYFPEYEYQLLLMPEKFSFSFSANFYLPRDVYNTSTSLLNTHMISIDFTDDIFYLLGNTNKENIFINLAISTGTGIVQPIGVHFKDIEVLHSDLMDFLGITSEIQDKDEISLLKEEIKQLRAKLEEKQNTIDSPDAIEAKGRISLPQKQLFALLVKKCYSGMDSRNKLFEVINADLKEQGIRNTEIKADTFYKLIDESVDFTKSIFPPKKS
ncbi:hypothetical protein VA608_05055 [Pasteurella multocida]|uniref:hypothetical protein n=1 Tax=Pasteurella multocida TaxID=747 RepID=UPI002D783B1F|nr:hypothetical protein [Pasteurella multocida]WRU39382.1 hypothetical protein VA608_05055 [Pasteurella multocida]